MLLPFRGAIVNAALFLLNDKASIVSYNSVVLI